MDGSKGGRKIVLLRNDTGPVLQGIFYEVDVKMVEVKVGKQIFRLKIFKQTNFRVTPLLIRFFFRFLSCDLQFFCASSTPKPSSSASSEHKFGF